MSNDILIPLLAVVTLTLVGGFALWQRGRVAKAKNEPSHSSFTKTHGEAPRPNQPGTTHQ